MSTPTPPRTVLTSAPNGCDWRVRNIRQPSPARPLPLAVALGRLRHGSLQRRSGQILDPDAPQQPRITSASRSTSRSSTAGPRATASARRRSPYAASSWPSPRPNANCANSSNRRGTTPTPPTPSTGRPKPPRASARIAFAYEERKAEAGRSTVFDFNDAKTRMEKAEADAVQAKYEFVFRSKILDFYRGKPLQL